MNRHHVRSALSVFKCALHRDDLTAEDAMSAAIETYLNLERKTGQDRRFYRPGRAVLPLCALLLSGCVTSPTALEIPRVLPCRVETMACFHGEAVLRVGARTIRTEAWSQDLPTPGFANRWHYLMPLETASALSPYEGKATEAMVGGAAVRWPGGHGGMYLEADDLWRLEMRPTDAGVAAQFGALAGAREYRKQHFTVRRLGSWVELLIEEPVR